VGQASDAAALLLVILNAALLEIVAVGFFGHTDRIGNRVHNPFSGVDHRAVIVGVVVADTIPLFIRLYLALDVTIGHGDFSSL
jgi:hypothetical protein